MSSEEIKDDPSVGKTAFDKLTKSLASRKSIPISFRC